MADAFINTAEPVDAATVASEADAGTSDADRVYCPGRGCPKSFVKKSGGLAKHLKKCAFSQQPAKESRYTKEG